jgi:phospholipase/carboxylesterase
MFELDGPRRPPAAGGKPASLVILLHGLGSDGDDLIALAPYWSRSLPHTAFVSPHAPFPCDMAPMGYQWFSFQDRDPALILAGVRAAAPLLDAFIDAEMKRHGLAADRVALVGFSQGTMMSLYVAPRRVERVACVVGYSGRLIDAGGLAQEMKSKPPVLLVHGDADTMVLFEAMEEAATGLRAAGIAVETERRRGLPHSIDDVGLAKGGAFIAKHFGG